MRSHLARHVCRPRTGILRDASHCQSRALCSTIRSPCVPAACVSKRSHPRRLYTTDPFRSDESEDKATQSEDSPAEGSSNNNAEAAALENQPTGDAEESASSPTNEVSQEATDQTGGRQIEAEFVSQFFSRHGGNASELGNEFDPSLSDPWSEIEMSIKEPEKPPSRVKPGKFHSQGDEGPEHTHPKLFRLPWVPESFRMVLRRQTSGVNIVTARSSSGAPVGATVSSFASVTLKPAPFFSINIKIPSKTMDAIMSRKVFNIHFLDSTKDGIEVAEKFVGRSRKCSKDQIWEHLEWADVESDPPLLKGSEVPFVFKCRLAFARKVGDHALVVGEVMDITPKRGIRADPKEHTGFLTFRDGWYREPGLDPDDKRSESNERREAQKLELLKLQEERRLAHERNQERVRESQLNRERRREYSHQRRQEAHERKEKGMQVKMTQTERWEEKIRADEREKMKMEGWMPGGELGKTLVDEAHPILRRESEPTTQPLETSEEASKSAPGQASRPDEPFIAPWRN